MEREHLDGTRLLLLLLPVVVLQLGLMVVALRDLSRRKSTRGPRWAWLVAIVFINILGPVLYFVIGRKDE